MLLAPVDLQQCLLLAPLDLAVMSWPLQTRSNALAWNPMEAFNFTAANEDCCLYTFDMRKLASATCVHKVRHLCA